MIVRILRTSLVALGLIAIGTGCGGSTEFHPVEGTVLLPDGKPAVGCTVEFTPFETNATRLTARGEVQADGSYKLKTWVDGVEKDGAMLGKHKVIVTPAPYAPGTTGDPTKQQELIPAKYKKYDDTPLSFVVKPGANSYPIALAK